jgi:hypothetical protein
MESQRRRKVVSLDAVSTAEPGGFGAFMQRWGNTALTVLLIGALLWLGIRWRATRAEQNRAAILSDLTTARTYVQVLENEPANQTPEYLARSRAAAAAAAGDAIALVLNTSDDPKLKAEALVDRGDLDWQLANFPDLPGAATQPALQPAMSVDQYLSRAAEAYQQILTSSDYANEHESAWAARFGLAAIAENRRQWDEARRQLQAVADDADAPAYLKSAAQSQITALPNMQTPLYVSSSTQPTAPLVMAPPVVTPPVVTPPAVTTPVTTRPPVATPASTRPVAMATTVPASAWKLGLPQPLERAPMLLKAATQPAMLEQKPASQPGIGMPAR